MSVKRKSSDLDLYTVHIELLSQPVDFFDFFHFLLCTEKGPLDCQSPSRDNAGACKSSIELRVGRPVLKLVVCVTQLFRGPAAACQLEV